MPDPDAATTKLKTSKSIDGSCLSLLRPKNRLFRTMKRANASKHRLTNQIRIKTSDKRDELIATSLFG